MNEAYRRIHPVAILSGLLVIAAVVYWRSAVDFDAKTLATA